MQKQQTVQTGRLDVQKEHLDWAIITDSRVVSVSGFKARGTGSRIPVGAVKISDVIQLMSCSFIEIMRLFVVSVCIN